MGEASVRAARAVDYVSAGTLEYLVSGEEFYFLEMNTRIQVEHTVTEMVVGIDLVREQIRIAAGERLSIAQPDVAPRGHAFECRINAEDAARRFLPSPGLITAYREPTGPGIRVDSGVRAGTQIAEIYDPMVAKLIVWDVDRESARRRMLRALDEYVMTGPATLIPFHKWLFGLDEFVAGGACHDELARLADSPTPLPDSDAHRSAARATPAVAPEPQVVRDFVAEVDGRRFGVRLRLPASQVRQGPVPAPRAKSRSKHTAGSGKPGSHRGRHDTNAGHRPSRAGRRGSGGRRGRRDLHRRGDEDGERGRGPSRRRRQAALGRRGPVG